MTPYAEGVFARQAGLPASANPYGSGWQAVLWARGWRSADDLIHGR